MQFAEQCPTEDEVSKRLETCKDWYAVIKSLPKPKADKPTRKLPRLSGLGQSLLAPRGLWVGHFTLSQICDKVCVIGESANKFGDLTLRLHCYDLVTSARLKPLRASSRFSAMRRPRTANLCAGLAGPVYPSSSISSPSTYNVTRPPTPL